MITFHLLVPSAGQGLRSGACVPKQFAKLGSQSLLAHTLDRFTVHPGLLSITLAVPDPTDPLTDLDKFPQIHRCAGGANRRDSVLAACRAMAKRMDMDQWVMVHDAARPVVARSDLDRLLETLQHSPAAYLVAPVVDTLRRHDGTTLDRDQIYRVLTPQCARLGDLISALDCKDVLTDEVDYLQRLVFVASRWWQQNWNQGDLSQ